MAGRLPNSCRSLAGAGFSLLGEVEELWDEVAIAMYPDRASMVRMSMSEEWREISVHRSAGLKGQLNIETVAPKTGEVSPFLEMILKGGG
jgi:hypothetical protein